MGLLTAKTQSRLSMLTQIISDYNQTCQVLNCEIRVLIFARIWWKR